MQIFDIVKNEYFILTCVLFVLGLVLYCTMSEGLDVSKDVHQLDNEQIFDTDTDVFAQSQVNINPQQPKTLSDAASQPAPLVSYYDDNLRGLDAEDPQIEGIDNKLVSDNYNNGYTLGVDLNDPEYKSLGVIQNTNKLISDDLLPKEKKDWFEIPSVGIKVEDANLLADATFRMGIDTLGNYRRGMTTDPRGAIPVPKIIVSPWNQSSRDPDTTAGWCTA